MPKIPALPPMTSVDTADELPIEDVSANTTKYITLTKLKEWFQSLVGWITTAMIGDSQVTAAKLSTSALLLGRSIVSATITPSGATETTIISTTITVPAGGRGVLLILTASQVNPNDGTRMAISFKESTTVLQRYYHTAQACGETFYHFVPAPSAGSHTYTVTSARDSGAGVTSWYADNTSSPASIELLAIAV